MFVEKLIDEVRQHPCLYDLKSPDYRHTNLKDRLWGIIATKLKVHVSFCKSKWRSLRDRNRRELAAIDQPSSSESSDKKPWEYLEKMAFLKSNQDSRRIGDDEFLQQYLESAVKEEPDPLSLPDLTQSPMSPAESLPPLSPTETLPPLSPTETLLPMSPTETLPPSSPVETLSPKSSAENLPPRSPAAILRPRLGSASSRCTSIQGPPKKRSRDNPHTIRKTLENNLNRFLNDATKSLQEIGSMEHFMLSIAADVEQFDWSVEKILKYKTKVSQLTLEIEAGDSD